MNKKSKIMFTSTMAAATLLSLAACGNANSSEEQKNYSYVMMNIPYSEFFAAEYEGGSEIDAVSSATMQKAGVSELTPLTYHTEDLSQILGVTYPVAVPDTISLDSSLKVDDVDSLYGAADYSYTVLDEEPSFYKEITEKDGSYSFLASVGEEQEQEYDSVSLKTDAVWSEYEIDFDESLSEQTVYAAMLKTEEGNSYGLRSLENVWRGFELGFTTNSDFKDPKESKLLTEPYKDLPGQTINQVVYYTADGIKVMDVDLYVPYQFENTIKIEDAAVSAGSTTFSVKGFPEDYDPVYNVEGASDDMNCNGKKITWKNALAGQYTLTISDASEKYASYTQTFVLSTDQIVAQADDANERIVAVDGVSDEQFAQYISNISSFTVGENTVSASGHGGAALIKEDGTVDKTQSRVFSAVGDYEVIVHAYGYSDITLHVNISEVAENQGHGEHRH